MDDCIAVNPSPAESAKKAVIRSRYIVVDLYLATRRCYTFQSFKNGGQFKSWHMRTINATQN